MANYRLFLDLDGVLVDFESGVQEVTGKLPHEQSLREMWGRLARTKNFYAELPWMPDGRRLWDYCRGTSPTILTGLPFGNWAEPQKREWCRRELGPEVPVITCFTKQKAKKAVEVLESGEIPVLVDDRERIKKSWQETGGVFILHTDAESSIGRLRELGV